MHLSVLSVAMLARYMHVWCLMCRGQMRALDPLELEL